MAVEGKGYDLLPGLSGSEGRDISQRLSRRGDVVSMPLGKPRCTLAKEGSYYVATNPTPGTAIDGIAGADGAAIDTESLIHIYNGNAAGSGVDIVLDYVKLLSETAGTNGTDVRYACKLDTGSRYTSGGSAIAEVCTNSNVTAASGAVVHFGALVTAAATASVRLVDHGLVRTVISVVGDQYLFDFGGDANFGAGQPVGGTTAGNYVVNVPPVVIGPGDSFVMSVHASSQTVAAGYEFAIGYWER